MARYEERNGQLIPMDKSGNAKKGRAFGVAQGSSRKPFSESLRERIQKSQAGGNDGATSTGAGVPEPPASFSIKCERCGLSFSNLELAQQHECEGAGRSERPGSAQATGGQALSEPELATLGAERSGFDSQPSPPRTCGLDGCNKSLDGKRPNVKYCSDKCKRRAAYNRRKKK